MTLREWFTRTSQAHCDVMSFDLLLLAYPAARAFKKVAVLIRLSAMMPSPTHRAMPAVP